MDHTQAIKDMLYASKVMGIATLVVELDEQRILDVIKSGVLNMHQEKEINQGVIDSLKLMAFMVPQLKQTVPEMAKVRASGDKFMAQLDDNKELDKKIKTFIGDITKSP